MGKKNAGKKKSGSDKELRHSLVHLILLQPPDDEAKKKYLKTIWYRNHQLGLLAHSHSFMLSPSLAILTVKFYFFIFMWRVFRE
jgi:hypothetical protein